VDVSERLLPHLLIVEVAALLVILAIIFGHALWLRWRARTDGPRLASARAALVAILNEPAGPEQSRSPVGAGPRACPVSVPSCTSAGHQGNRVPAARVWLPLPGEIERLSTSQQVDLFAALAASLDGAQRVTLTTLARDLGLIAHAERRCRSRFWWRRLDGCRLLTLVGGGESIVPSLLNDPHPVVRAQAATWAADHPEPAIVAALLNRLAVSADGSHFALADSLLRLGRATIEPLAAYLSTHRGREVGAALDVAIGLADPRLLQPALTLCRDAEPQVRALAAMLIGALGGEETVQELLDLLDDPADDVRAAAAEALGRLGYWPAAASLALRLRDRAWQVRSAAGLALRDFGAPGILYLRRALTDEDPFAADMARQLLDLSALVGEPL
jgi:hypothetical protein